MWVAPLRHGVLSLRSTLPSRLMASRSLAMAGRVLESKTWENYATTNHYIPFYAGRAETQKQLAALYQQLKGALTDVGMAQ
jgi:tripartite-type tricarboxylate transporter receptor subunit TctC